MESYREQTNEKYRLKIKELLPLLPDYCTSFVNHLINNKPRTRYEYLQDIKVFFVFLKQANPVLKDVPIKAISIDVLAELKGTDIDEYMMWLESYYIESNGKQIHITNGEAGRKRKLCALRVFYDYLCYDLECVPKNPTARTKTPKVDKKEIITVQPDELPKILDFFHKEYEEALNECTKYENKACPRRVRLAPYVSKRDYAIFIMFLGTGIRLAELVGLNTLDIKFDTGRVNLIRKGGDADYIYMNPEVLDVIADYNFNVRETFEPFSEDDALFISSQHKRMSESAIEKNLKERFKLALGADTKLTPHKLRATYASNYYRETGSIRDTADVLGHSSVETTSKYYAKKTEKAKQNMKDINIFSIEE